ncbi:hypothetical protein PPERSA_04555 [Pseudocohnilembus persalinus]|uniref:RING-type domain-containing protein n=1 Tax=Pseudocohnilembus persalinus TaxID=266149 RepID=A0A0V0QED2_PSEPJ|nr:hypothetical protein PPERSA_04555 [Pseudocohnilembus persalinus]|eukprot:KRX00534.1 hypothetical protein PPERSA_04555 [Pseudocohnilembus persalinus]
MENEKKFYLINLNIILLGLGFIGGQLYKEIKDMRQRKQNLQHLKNSPIYTPKGFKNEFSVMINQINNNKENQGQENPQQEIKPQSVFDNSDVVKVNDFEFIIKNIMVQGKVHSSEYFTSQYNQEKKLIHKYIQKDLLYSNDRLWNKKNIMKIDEKKQSELEMKEDLKIQQVPFFQLKEGKFYKSVNIMTNLNKQEQKEEQEQIIVHNSWETIVLEKCLDWNKIIKEQKEVNFIKKLMVDLGLFIEIIIGLVLKDTFYIKPLFFKGVEMGNLIQEKGISLGSIMCIFGDIKVNLIDNQMTIESPLYFFNGKQELMKYTQKQITRKQLKILGLGFLSLFGCYQVFKLIRKIQQINNKNQLKREPNKNVEQMNVLQEVFVVDNNKFDLNFQCKVCKNRQASIVLIPCKHLAFCKKCIEGKLEDNQVLENDQNRNQVQNQQDINQNNNNNNNNNVRQIGRVQKYLTELKQFRQEVNFKKYKVKQGGLCPVCYKYYSQIGQIFIP